MGLVLDRYINQSIVIGDNLVKITIKSINSDKNQVRLICEGDDSISIHRQEIYNKVKNDEVCYEQLILNWFEEMSKNDLHWKGYLSGIVIGINNKYNFRVTKSFLKKKILELIAQDKILLTFLKQNEIVLTYLGEDEKDEN